MSCTEGNVYGLLIPQGTTWVKSLWIKSESLPLGINITGYTFQGQIRKSYSSPTALVSFTFTIVDALTGKLTMSLTATQTDLLPVLPATGPLLSDSEYIYDVQWIAPAGAVSRLMYGQVFISPEVTRT